MTTSQDFLADLLQASRLTAIVDIGANPIDGTPPYQRMLAKHLCTVVGFEPQAAALESLNTRKSDFETYLPYAVGDGSRGVLKVCQASGMSSLLTPEPSILECFLGFVGWGTVIQEVPVVTKTLDSIVEIDALDLLKIDVQGGELSVFRNGSSRLAKAVAVQTEVSFVPLYKNQPIFGEIDLALRALGFIPHMFAQINKRMILPCHNENQPFAPMNQLLEADIVYVRNFSQPDNMESDQLKHLALIAHHCYGSYDLTIKCLHDLTLRGSIDSNAVGQYLSFLKQPN